MSNKKAWFKAAKTGDINQLKTLLEADSTLIDAKDSNDHDYTAVSMAVRSNHLATVNYFCENHNDKLQQILKDRNKYGYTALLVAAFHGRLEIVQYFLETYTSLNPPLIKDKNDAGQTAFMVAIERGQTAIFEYLLEFSQRHRDYTDLMVEIIRKNDPATVQWLLDNGADVNAQDADGSTVMHHIFASCVRFPLTALEVYQRVKLKQPDMAIKNKEGKTAYQIKGYDPQILPLNEPTRGLIAHVNHDACFTPNAKYISAPSSREMHENGIWWHEFVLMMLKDRKPDPDNYINITCSAFLHFQPAPDTEAIINYRVGMHYFVDKDKRTVSYCMFNEQTEPVPVEVTVDFAIFQTKFEALFPAFSERGQIEKAFIENRFTDIAIEEQWKRGIAITAGAVQELGLLREDDPASFNRLDFLKLEAQEGKCMGKLQDIYESLVDLPDDSHSKVSAIDILHDGIGVCQTGVGGRISIISKKIIALKTSSQCMDDLLYLYREQRVEALRHIDIDFEDIHTNNHVATFAAIGFGTKAQEPGDRGGISSDKKTRALLASFREGFRYYSLKNGLMPLLVPLLRQAIEKAGYTGEKAIQCWPVHCVDKIMFDEHKKVASDYNGSYIYTEEKDASGRNFFYIALSGSVTPFPEAINKLTLENICRSDEEPTLKMPAKLENRIEIFKTMASFEFYLINVDEYYEHDDLTAIFALFKTLFNLQKVACIVNDRLFKTFVFNEFETGQIQEFKWEAVEKELELAIEKQLFACRFDTIAVNDNIVFKLPEAHQEDDIFDFFKNHYLSVEQFTYFYWAYFEKIPPEQQIHSIKNRLLHYYTAQEYTDNTKVIIEFLIANGASLQVLTALRESIHPDDVNVLVEFDKQMGYRDFKQMKYLNGWEHEPHHKTENTAYTLPSKISYWWLEEKTPLMVAISHGNRELVEDYLKQGANVNIANAYGWTSLHELALFSRKDKKLALVMLDQLLAYGANPLVQLNEKHDKHDHTPSDMTGSLNNPVRKKLLQLELNHAIQQGDMKQFDRVMYKGADLNVHSSPQIKSNYKTDKALLHEAESHYKAVKDSLQKELDVLLQDDRNVDVELNELFRLQLLADNSILTAFEVPHFFQPAERLIATILQAVLQQYAVYSFEAAFNQEMPAEWIWRIERIMELAGLSNSVAINQDTLTKIVTAIHEEYRSNPINIRVTLYTDEGELVGEGEAVEDALSPTELRVCQSKQHYLLIAPVEKCYTPREQHMELSRALQFQGGVLTLLCESRIKANFGDNLALVSVNDIKDFYEDEKKRLSSIHHFTDFIRALNTIFSDQMFADNTGLTWAMRILQRLAQFEDSPKRFYPFQQHYLKTLHDMIRQTLLARSAEIERLQDDEPLHALEKLIVQKEAEIKQSEEDLADNQRKIIEQQQGLAKKISKEAQLRAKFERDKNALKAKMCAVKSALIEKEEQHKALKEQYDNADAHATGAQVAHLDNEAAIAKLRDEAALLQEKERRVTAVLRTLADEVGMLKVEAERLQVDQKKLEEDKNKAENKRKTSTAVLTFVKAIQTVMSSEAFMLDKQKQCREKIASLRESGHYNLRELYDFLVNTLTLQALQSDAVEAEIANASDYFHACLDAIDELVKEPNKPTDIDNGTFKYHGFNLSWEACYNALTDAIKNQLNRDGLELNNNGHVVVKAGSRPLISQLPEALRTLMGRHLKHLEAPDYNPEGLSTAVPTWNILKTEDAAVAKTCIERFQLTLPQIIHCFVQKVELIAGNHIWVDENIDLPGVDITLYAQQHIILRPNCTIKTSGADAPEHADLPDHKKKKARNGAAYRGKYDKPQGQHGVPGLYGLPGMSAGHIALKANGKIVNLETLTCEAKGGKGGAGQEGGDGDKGRDGGNTQDAVPDDCPTSRDTSGWANLLSSSSMQLTNRTQNISRDESSSGNSWMNLAEARIPGVDQYGHRDPESTLISGDGGDGGPAGRGGYDGNAGDITIEDSSQEIYVNKDRPVNDELRHRFIAPVEKNGITKGVDGNETSTGGEAGEAGYLGYSVFKTKRLEIKKSVLGLSRSHHWVTKTHRADNYDIEKYKKRFAGKYDQSSWSKDYSQQYSSPWYAHELETLPNKRQSIDERSRGEDKSNRKDFGKRPEHPCQKATKHPNEYLQAAHKTSLQQKADRLANLHHKLVKNIEQSITEKNRSLDQAIQTLNQQLGEVNSGIATKVEQIGHAEQAINQKADEKQSLEQKIAEVATAIAEKEADSDTIAETLLASLAGVSHIANALSQAELAMQCAQVDIDTVCAVENKLKQAQARLETLLSDQHEQLTQGMDELFAAKHGLEALITAQRTLCEQLKNDHARKSDEQTYLAKRQEILHETIATFADETIHHETQTEQCEHAIAVDAPLLPDANRVLLTGLDTNYSDERLLESIEVINASPDSGAPEVTEEEILVTEDLPQAAIFAEIEQKACDGKYPECVIELQQLVQEFRQLYVDEENTRHLLQQHLSQLTLKNTDWLALLAQLDALHDRLLMSIIIDQIDILALNESVHFIEEIGRANQSEKDIVIEQIIGFTMEKWQKQWVTVKKTMGHVKEWEKLQATTRKMLQMIYAGSSGLSIEIQLYFLKNFNGILLTFDGVKNSEDYLRECEQLSAEFLQETKKALSAKIDLEEVVAEKFYASVLEKIVEQNLHATLHNKPQFFQQYLFCLEQAFNTNIDWSALEKIVNQLKNVVSQSSNTNDIQLWYAFLNSIDIVIDAHYVQAIHAQIKACKDTLGEEQSTRQKIDEHLKQYTDYFQTNHEKKLLVQLLLRKMINNGHSFDDINQIKTVDGLIQAHNIDGLKTLSSLSLFSVTPEFNTLREELNKEEAGDCKKIFAEWSNLLQSCIHGIRDQGQEKNSWTPELIKSFINDSMQLCEHVFFDAIEDQTIMYRCAQCLEDLPQLPESINAQSIEKWAVFLQASAYRVDFYRNVDLLVERFEEKSHYQSRVDVMDKLESEELPRFRTLMKVLCLTGEGERHALMMNILAAFSVEKIQKNAQESLTAVRNVLDNTQKIIFPEPANNESGALSQLRACFDQIKQSTTSAQVRQHFTALYFQLLMQDIDLADLKIFAQEMLAWQETHVRVDFYRNSIFVVLTQLIFSKIEEQHKDNPDPGVFMDSLRSLQALSATQPRNTLHACVLLNNGVNTEAIQTIINAGYHTDENLADLFCHRLEKIQAEENPSDDDKSAITFLLALLPFSVNCAAIFQATLSALQKDHAKKELKPILIPVMLHLQTTLCEQAINSWITHPIFSLRLQQFMKGLTESYLDISAEEDKEAVIRELNRMYTFITTTDRSNIKSDFDFIKTYCEQNPEDHEFFINNILSDTELLFASRLDKPVVLEILYNNPSTQWQSLLKKHYWENKVCTPLFDGFLKSDTTAFEDAPINDKLEELAKTDSCSRAKLITAQLQERIEALPDESHSAFKQNFGKDLEAVSRCKKQLASSHAIAVAENEEALWLRLMDRVLHYHCDGLSLDHVNTILHVAQFFPSLSMVNALLIGDDSKQVLHALLFQFVCLAAEKNVIFEEKTALNLHVLNDTVFSTDNGLILLEALGKALYFGSNQAIQTMTATQFNALIQQCMDVKVYHDPALVKDLSTRPIYYWDAVLKRRQLALQLGLKRENKTHQAILESLLTLQKEVDKKLFEQWIHQIQKNIPEKTDAVYKQISIVFGFFASCEWTMDDAAFQVIANAPVHNWKILLSAHFEKLHDAEDSKKQRSVVDLVQIMRADTSGINGCGHVLMLPDQGTMPAKIDENTIIFERKDRAITFFWQEAGGIVQKSVDEIVINDIITALPRSGESTDQTLFQKITLCCGRTRINDGFDALLNPAEGALSLEDIINKAECVYKAYKEAPEPLSKEKIIDIVKLNFNVKTRKGAGPHEFLRNGGKGDDGKWTELIEFLGFMMYAYYHMSQEKREIRYTQLVALIGFIHGFDTSKGRLANISTGQGKTLITQMLAIACALRGDQPDVITSSKVLAEPNAKEAEDFLSYFGLTVSCNCDKAAEENEDVRRERYAKHDVIYGDIGSFQRDKLLTVGLGKAIRPNASRCLIIDEVDSLLIDNADKVLYISHAINDFEHLRETFLFIWQAVHAKDTHAYSENHVEMIVELYQHELKEKTLDALEDAETQHLIPYVDQHLRDWIRSAYQAKSMITNERQYSLMEKQGEQRVVINDLPTGVEQMNSRWSNGLHAFLELKHRQMVSKETLRAVYDSNVSYVNTYAESGQLFGMTGTLGKKPERDLLSNIYHGVKFFSVPRFRREKYTQTKAVVCGIASSEWEKAILASITDQKNKRRASLLICEDKKSAEILRDFLEKVIEKPCRIRSYVSSAQEKSVTNAEPCDIIIATNIAGRGTDLELSSELKANGGLHVILTYVPSNIRIEEQAFGRAARSDEAGSGQFIVQDARANNMHTVSIEQLRDERDEFERIRLMDIQQVKVPALAFSQRLLRLFLDLQADVTKKLEGKHETWIALQQKSLQDSWAFWRDAYEFSIKQIHQGGEAEILAAFEHWKTSQLSLFDSNEDKLVTTSGELMHLAKFYQDQGQHQSALRCYDNVIKLAPNFCGFAHYYRAQALIRLNSSSENKTAARRSLKKAIESFEKEIARLSTSNQVIRVVGEQRREQGEGLEADVYTKQNIDEMGVINIHIRAAKTALGSELKKESFENGEALAEEAIIVFNNLRQAMSQDTLKDYRLSGKAMIVQEQSQSVLYYKDQKIQWFGLFKEAEKEIMAYLASKVKTQATDDRKSYSDRRVDLNDLKKFVLTQDKWLTYLKDVLIEKEIFTLPENFTALLSGDSRWKNSIYQGDGPAIRDRLKTYTPPKTKEDFIAAMQVSEDIIAHLIAEKILISQKSYCFKDAARELIKPYLEQPCPVENQLLTALNLHETASYFHRAIEEQIMHCAKKGIFTKEDINLPENDTDPVQHFWADLVNQGVAKNPKVYFPETTDSKRVIKNRLNAVKNEVADKIDAIIAGITKLAPPSEEDKIALHKLYSKERHYLESLINQRQISSEKPIPLTPQEREKIQEENRRIDNIQRLKEAICNALSDSVGTLRTIDRVKLSNQALESYFQQGKLPPIVIDYMQNACSDVLSLIEDIQKKNTDWDVFCCVMLGIAQIVAGVLVAPMCPMLGEMLIGEGVGDIMFAVQSHISGEFSWKAYQEHKKQSLTTSLMFMGVGAALKSGKTVADGVTAAKAAEEAVKYSVSQELTKELTKAAIQVAVDVSITMAVSSIADDMVKSIFSDFKGKFSASVKSQAKHEIERISNSMKTLYKKVGEAQANQMFQQSIRDLDLQKVMMHHIDPKAMSAVQAIAKKLSAYKSADSKNSTLRSIGKAADLLSTLLVVEGYTRSVIDITNTSAGLFEQLAASLDRKVDRFKQQENIPSLSDEEITRWVDAHVSDMTHNVLQQIQQQVQQVFNRAGNQLMNAALESEIDKAKQWLLAGIDNFYKRDEIRDAKVRVEQMAETPAIDEHHAVLQRKQGELLTEEDLNNTAIEEVKQLKAKTDKSLAFTVKDDDVYVVNDQFSQSLFEDVMKDEGKLAENQSIDPLKDPAKKSTYNKATPKIGLQSKEYTPYTTKHGKPGIIRHEEKEKRIKTRNGRIVPKKFDRKPTSIKSEIKLGLTVNSVPLVDLSYGNENLLTSFDVSNQDGTSSLWFGMTPYGGIKIDTGGTGSAAKGSAPKGGQKLSVLMQDGTRYAQGNVLFQGIQCSMEVVANSELKAEVVASTSKLRRLELGGSVQAYLKKFSIRGTCKGPDIDIPIVNKTLSLSVSGELLFGVGAHAKAGVFVDRNTGRAKGNLGVGGTVGAGGGVSVDFEIANTKPTVPSQEASNQRRTNQESVYRNNRSTMFSSFSDYVSRSDQYDQHRTEARRKTGVF